MSVWFLSLFAGKPRPRITWYRNDKHFNEQAKTWTAMDTLSGMEVTKSNLTLDSLGREDVFSEITCEATNFQATFLRTTVQINMKCKLLVIYVTHHKNLIFIRSSPRKMEKSQILHFLSIFYHHLLLFFLSELKIAFSTLVSLSKLIKRGEKCVFGRLDKKSLFC